MLKPTKILVPTDFSEYSDKALKQALDIAQQYHATRHAASARVMMEKQLKKFPEAEAIEVHIEVGKGNPFEAILDEERKKGIDLIVIASLGRTGLAKYFIGNVARNVLKGATAPVLLTR
jgi:universal stress protein A